MNWLLIIVVLLVAGNMVWGFEKGFIRVLYSVAGWIGALVLAVYLTKPLEVWLESVSAVHGKISGMFVAFFVALALTKLLLLLVVKILDLVAKLPLLKQTNRLLGILAGTGKGIFVVEILMLLIALGHNIGVAGLVVELIYQSPILTFLYENNIVKIAIMAFL